MDDKTFTDDAIAIPTQAETPIGSSLALSDASRARLIQRIREKDRVSDRIVVERVIAEYYERKPDEICDVCGQRMVIRYLFEEGGWIAPMPQDVGPEFSTDYLVAFVACACGGYGFVVRDEP